jgi:hypothetical protein
VSSFCTGGCSCIIIPNGPDDTYFSEAEKVNALLKDKSLDLSQEEREKMVLKMAEVRCVDECRPS